MTPGTMRRSLGLAAAVLASSLPGCESPTPPASLPPFPPPPPPLLDFGDERPSAECRSVNMRAAPPQRLSEESCFEYAIDLSVEVENGDAMAMDFFGQYAISDWRVRRSGRGFRHDVRVIWDVRKIQFQSSFPEVWPLVIPVCPERDEGPVLVCSESSCDMHESLDSVRPFVPAGADFAFRTPYGNGSVLELREGETLEVPVSYAAYADLPPVVLDIAVDEARFGPGLLRVSPPAHELGALRTGDSGTVIFRLAAAVPQGVDRESLFVWVRPRQSGVRGCVESANFFVVVIPEP